jgi:hypothetical protein
MLKNQIILDKGLPTICSFLCRVKKDLRLNLVEKGLLVNISSQKSFFLAAKVSRLGK